MLKCSIQGNQFLLINYYAPNIEIDQTKVFWEIVHNIGKLNHDNECKIIWGGDFNLCFKVLDSDGGNYKHKYASVSILEKIMFEMELIDIWRLRNPLLKKYTWRTRNPLVQRRLDYFIIANNLQNVVAKTDIIPCSFTDHSAISMHLSSHRQTARGPAYWRMNTSLLDDDNYIKNLREILKNCKSEYDNYDSRNLWELLKYKIREYAIAYSKQKQRTFRNDLLNLEAQLSNLDGTLCSDESDENREAYYECQVKLNEMQNHITRGVIIRSKIKWYEEDEKCTNYFLNLEKQNKEKSSIYKLVDKEQEITSENDILKSIKDFYKSKYSRQSGKSIEDCLQFLNSYNIKALPNSKAIYYLLFITTFRIPY